MKTFEQMPLKKVWEEPRLITYGSVEQITEQTVNKQVGAGDTVMIKGIPFATVSSPNGGPVS